MRRGYEETAGTVISADGKYSETPYQEVQTRWGTKTPRSAGEPHIGSTVSTTFPTSREGYIPLFLKEKCINCGLCDTTCPDMVFGLRRGEYKGKPALVNVGADYHHCKELPALRCHLPDRCPGGRQGTRNTPDKAYFVRNKDLIAENIDFEAAGANSWVTSGRIWMKNAWMEDWSNDRTAYFYLKAETGWPPTQPNRSTTT